MISILNNFSSGTEILDVKLVGAAVPFQQFNYSIIGSSFFEVAASSDVSCGEMDLLGQISVLLYL